MVFTAFHLPEISLMCSTIWRFHCYNKVVSRNPQEFRKLKEKHFSNLRFCFFVSGFSSRKDSKWSEWKASLIDAGRLINLWFHFRIGLCVFSGYKIYPGMGKTLVKADGKVSGIAQNILSSVITLLLLFRPSPSSTRSASVPSSWSATRVRWNGPSCTVASTRRESRKSRPRSEHAAQWSTPERSSVPPWLTSWPSETWSPRSARLNASRPSSEFHSVPFGSPTDDATFRAAKEQKKSKAADKKAKVAPSKSKSKPTQKQQKAAPRVGGKR